MASRRDAVRMDPAQTVDFLREQMKVQVATIGADGAPHLTTLFYVLDAEDRIAFWTYGASQKVVNLRRDPRISALVEDGEAYDELRGVSITGRATLLEEHDDVRALGLRVARRMLGDRTDELDLGDAGRDLVDRQARKRVGIVVHPEQVASWDHSRMD